MIELLPQIYQPLFLPLRPCFERDAKIEVTPDYKLIWQLYADRLGFGYYQCQTAVCATRNYEHNQTPFFKLIENDKRIKAIPEEIEKWMNNYADTFTTGALWARSVGLK